MNCNKRFNQYSQILRLINKKSENTSKKAHKEIKAKALSILIPFK